MKSSDLSAEEAEVEWRRCQVEADERAKDEDGVMRGPPTDDQGKIRFRKPKVRIRDYRQRISKAKSDSENRR